MESNEPFRELQSFSDLFKKVQLTIYVQHRRKILVIKCYKCEKQLPILNKTKVLVLDHVNMSHFFKIIYWCLQVLYLVCDSKETFGFCVSSEGLCQAPPRELVAPELNCFCS
uniref:Uncharacterized protein n=1 Tax=Marmota marmota marmota TaxID=9994 RepID=A0A8C6A7B3_MARMA